MLAMFKSSLRCFTLDCCTFQGYRHLSLVLKLPRYLMLNTHSSYLNQSPVGLGMLLYCFMCPSKSTYLHHQSAI